MPIGVYKHIPHKGTFKKGVVPWITGKKHSEETKQKMREKALGKGNSQYGKLHSEEHKRKIGEAVKGDKHPMFGKKHTTEARFKIKLARSKQIIPKGRKISLEKIEKIFTPEYRKILAIKFSGINNPQWKGGITPLNHKIRESKEYKQWRKSVFERDNYTCIKCGAKNGLGKTVKLNADHIKRFAQYPELRFELSNGRTLCEPCHRKTDTYGRFC